MMSRAHKYEDTKEETQEMLKFRFTWLSYNIFCDFYFTFLDTGRINRWLSNAKKFSVFLYVNAKKFACYVLL